MNTRLASLLATGAVMILLAGCGSDSSASSSGSAAATTGGATQAAADSGSGGKVSSACDVTTRETVASVFPGVGAGKPGQLRNCEYSFSSGSLSKINIYYYANTDLAQYKQGAVANGVKVTSVDVGDMAIRDQLHSVTVQKGNLLFGVAALPKELSKLGNYDTQVLALAKKIAAQH